jgi:hypothetical protein
MARIAFDFGGLTLQAELLDTATARAIAAALPYEARVMTWGEEVYFDVPVDVAREPDARAVVVPGGSRSGRKARASPSASAAPRSAAATNAGWQAHATYSRRLPRT